ncbi:MAG TPA: methionyl-tRNA formyltransferase [Armatimonadota bacterium]
MKILYFGTSTFAIPPLQALLEHGDVVVAVVTQPDLPAGRGRQLSPSPVKAFALTHDLPVLQPESCRHPDFFAQAHALAPDLIVVAAYGQFLPDELLELPPLGSVNLHGSLLPRYRGAAPIQRALWEGETTTGVCLMWMARAMDAGDIIACADEPIAASDTAGTLSERLSLKAAALLLAWLSALASGSAPRQPQDPSLVTFAPPIRKEERVIDWTRPAEVIWRQIRALAPTPAAVTTFRGSSVKLFASQPLATISTREEGEPGGIVESNPKLGLYVATGAGDIEILSLQPAGKRPMSGADFLRGYHITAGERFTS